MHTDELELQELIKKGQSQGYLTYDEINSYLPDEDVTPEKLDNLLIALEEVGIELVNEPPAQTFHESKLNAAPSAGNCRKRRNRRRCPCCPPKSCPS